MDPQMVIDILNELLVLEQRILARRLLESTVFVSPLTVATAEWVQDMVQASHEHAEWLTTAVLDLDGSPGLRVGDPTSADLHYQELRQALPRLVREHEALLSKYALASERLAAEPRAGEPVLRIFARHQEHLDALKRLVGQTANTAE